MDLRALLLPARRATAALVLGLAVALSAAAAPQEPETGPSGPPPTPPTVVGIRVEGEQRYTEEQLRAALGQQVGARLDPLAVQRGIETLWDVFKVRATVDRRDVEGGVELRLSVLELPVDREPRFVGNSEVDEDELREWAGIEDQTELYLHQAPRVRQRLIESYRREGFYWVEIEVVTRGGEQVDAALAPDVIFLVQEGPKVRVADVVLHGNESMPDSGALFWKDGLSHLAGRQLGGPSLFHWWGKAFVEEALEADLVAMRGVYRERGWLDAVVELERLDFNEDRDRVDVHVVIDEGPRYRIGELSIEAVEWEDPDRVSDESTRPDDLLFPAAELLELCELQPGEWFETRTLARDRQALQEHYGGHGYVSHSSLPRRLRWTFLEPLYVYDVQDHTVDVTYRLAQGRQLRVREITFAGTEHTRDQVLRRELSVFPGDLADLNQIQRSLRRIQGTGYFSDPNNPLDHPEPRFRFREVEGSEEMVDLEFVVEEGRVVDFNVSGGIDTNNGLFAILSLSMRNFDIARPPSSPWAAPGEIYRKEAFHGAGQRLDIEVSPGTEVRRLRIRWLEPDIFGLYRNPISLDVDLFARDRLFDIYDESRTVERVRLGRRFGFDFSAFVGLQLAQLDVDDLETDSLGQPDVPPSLERQAQMGDSNLNGALLDFVYRDLDNLLVPREGLSYRVNNAVYGEFLEGDYEYWSTIHQFDYYYPVWETAKGVPTVLHFEFDTGYDFPYGDTDEVPYTERFFLGGGRTLRGFAFRGVGPVDEGDPLQFMDSGSGEPLGGESYISGTFELQFPLGTRTQRGTFETIETFRGQVFLDYGVLDPNGGIPDLSDMRASLGFGVGLAAPFPLSLNFGFPILIEDGDDRRVFSFSLGF